MGVHDAPACDDCGRALVCEFGGRETRGSAFAPARGLGCERRALCEWPSVRSLLPLQFARDAPVRPQHAGSAAILVVALVARAVPAALVALTWQAIARVASALTVAYIECVAISGLGRFDENTVSVGVRASSSTRIVEPTSVPVFQTAVPPSTGSVDVVMKPPLATTQSVVVGHEIEAEPGTPRPRLTWSSRRLHRPSGRSKSRHRRHRQPRRTTAQTGTKHPCTNAGGCGLRNGSTVPKLPHALPLNSFPESRQSAPAQPLRKAAHGVVPDTMESITADPLPCCFQAPACRRRTTGLALRPSRPGR